jgi:phospholipid/cholesterol/gamma-HCH transport system substrate-binding protein
MRFRIRFADQIVGCFVLLAVLGIAALLVFMGINQRWFAKNYYFKSRFGSGDGLSVGMSIALKGFPIGKISKVRLNAENQVDVEFFVQDTYYDKVRPNSILELAPSPLGLGGGMKFHPGTGEGAPQPEMSFIPSLAIPEGQALVKAGLVDLPQNEELVSSLLAKVNPILDDIRSTLVSVKTLVNTVDSAVTGKSGPIGGMLTDLQGTPGKVNGAVDNIRDRTNAILDRIAAVSDNLDAITVNVKTTTDSLRDTKGLVTRLLDPKGSIENLLDDNGALLGQIRGTIDDTKQVIAQVRGFVEYINSSRPQISGLLEKGKETLDQGKDVLEAAKNNWLLKGGIPERKEQVSTTSGQRGDF